MPDKSAVQLFSPLTIGEVTFRNRLAVAPMCQYSALDGVPNDWHLAHLGSRAVGGAGLVIAEATAVEPRARISPRDLGLWSDDLIKPMSRLATFVESNGAVAGIQIAHAGRKAGTDVPWVGRCAAPEERGGWTDVVGPSPLEWADGLHVPIEMTNEDLVSTRSAFAAAASRAHAASFRYLELHGAHGYLLHSFLSPLSNVRTDAYGGSLQNRMRFPLEVVRAVREVWPERLPLAYRVSATDWLDGGWNPNDTIVFATELKALGVDVIVASSGGTSPSQEIQLEPGYQVPFASRIRREVNIQTMAVGLITESSHAEHILTAGDADLIAVARQVLRDPYWPLHAALELGVICHGPTNTCGQSLWSSSQAI